MSEGTQAGSPVSCVGRRTGVSPVDPETEKKGETSPASLTNF